MLELEAEVLEGEIQLAPHIVSHPARRGGKPTLDTIAITVDHVAYWYIIDGKSVDYLIDQIPVDASASARCPGVLL